MADNLVQTQTKTFTHFFEIKSVSEETIYNGVRGVFIQGYLAIFGPRDRDGENWGLPLEDLNSPTNQAIKKYFSQNPILLYEHGLDPQVRRQALGYTVEYRVDALGIWVKDFVPAPPEKSGPICDIYNKIKAGVYKCFSIAGRWIKDRVNTIVELTDFFEHSVVSVPMHPDATFSLSKSLREVFAQELSVKEAITLAKTYSNQGQAKAGRMLSAANLAAIYQAISVLQELCEMQAQRLVPPSTQSESEMEECWDEATEPYIQEALKALVILKGITKMDDDKKDVNHSGATGAGATPSNTTNEGRGANTITLPEGIDGTTLIQIIDNFKAMQMDAEVTRIAEQKAAALQAQAEADAQAEQERLAEVDRRVEEKLKTMKIGQPMLYAPSSADNAAVFGRDRNGNTRLKSVNQNKGIEDFSLLKFARAGYQGREWQYVEDWYAKAYGAKAINESVGSEGGYYVPDEYSTEVVDLLRAQAVVRAMGAKTFKMKRDTLTKPRRAGSVTAYWGAENATMTVSQGSYGQIRFVARKLYAIAEITKEMMMDSDPSIEADVREDIAAQLALKEDDGFLQGSGIGETPLGILNTGGILNFDYTTGAVSAGPEHTNLIKGGALVRNSNAKPNGIVMHSRVNDGLMTVKDTTGQPSFKNIVGGYNWSQMNLAALSRNSNDPNQVEIGELLGLKQALANQLSVTSTTTGTSPVIIGDWTKCQIADRQDIEIEVDRSQGFFKDLIYIKATKRCDFVLTLPEAMCVIKLFPAIDVA